MPSFEPPRELLTEHFELCIPCSEDAPALYAAYTSNSEAASYLQRAPHKSAEETLRFIENWGEDSWRVHGRRAWIIRRRSSGTILGLFLLIRIGTAAQIHFGISPESWGHGVMREVGRGVLDWIARCSTFDRVETYCDCENTRALRVLEKIGLERQSLLPQHIVLPHFGGQRRDCWSYAWTRRDVTPL